MNKIVILLILIGITYYAWENIKPDQEVISAKKELGLVVDDNIATEAKKEIFEAVDNAITGVKESISEVVSIPTFSTEYLTDNKFLELNIFEESDLSDKEIELTGKTLESVDKIRILYTNKDSDFPDDDFTLQKFKSGDSDFLYRAFARYETFDFGTNIYTFFAYSGEEVSKMELTIYYPNPDIVVELNNTDLQVEGEKIDVTQLPTSAEYGSPIKMGEDKITYSDINGFEVSNYVTDNVSCESENITQTLQSQTSSWSWWNTCRPSEDEKSISFFALSMVDGDYTYSKHYFSKNKYAIVELEKGLDESWNTLESITEKNDWLKEKNNSLKIKNENFEIIKVTDNLFTEITE